MDSAERYQHEFDGLMQDLDLRAERAEHLRGIERLDQLFAVATSVGIDERAAWRIVERDPTDPKRGLLDLIEELRRRSR